MKQFIAITFLSISTAIFAQEKPKSSEVTKSSKSLDANNKEVKMLNTKGVSQENRASLKANGNRPITNKK